MDKPCGLLLRAMKAALRGKKVDWDEEITREDWLALLELAQTHRVLPMVLQAVYDCPAAGELEPSFFAPYRAQVRRLVMVQMHKDGEFLPLLEKLRSAGVEPLVVKGIVCRSLYPNPEFRMSSDEDLLIPPEKFPICHAILTENGLTTPDPEGEAYEVPYRQSQGVLYLEVHKSLFPEENQAYGDLNRFFREAWAGAVVQNGVPTLAPTEHMLFLICHAFKHFIHSGFGIRQVCDMLLYAESYGAEIDWEYVRGCCREIRAEGFAAGVFRIGWKHLGFSPEETLFPRSWRDMELDEEPLLADILLAGVYGTADMSRKHSANMTLHAVETQKRGASGGSGILRSLFPPAKELHKRYPYLKKSPLLLPVAWADRILKYSRETRHSRDNDPGESIRIGSARIGLLKQYGIIDE